MGRSMGRSMNPERDLDRYVVTAAQMQAIESRVFAAGMPVAALMEKVAGLIARRVIAWRPIARGRRVGVLAGPGHNGGDALVVARELHLRGYEVAVWLPLDRRKELTDRHAQYAVSLGIAVSADLEPVLAADWIVDGLFGFGLERPIEGELATAIARVNVSPLPVVSIDLPSGLHTDTGEVLGTAVRATRTLCLGLWKRGLLLDRALESIGTAELIDFDLPLADIQAVLGDRPRLQRVTRRSARLPLERSPVTHKYQQGHLLLVAGSADYMGAALLAALGARSSGVGMLTVAVPASLKPWLVAQVPEALVVACPETPTGAIGALDLDLSRYDAIACGCGLTRAAGAIVQTVWASDRPLVLDADGLNGLAEGGWRDRAAPVVITPHRGEFRRLFPDLDATVGDQGDSIELAQRAAHQTGAIVLLKGARTVVAEPGGRAWIVPESTPALARGGSGDVFAGVLGGLLARSRPTAIADWGELTAAAADWHARAGIHAAAARSILGVDGASLAESLLAVAREDWVEGDRLDRVKM